MGVSMLLMLVAAMASDAVPMPADPVEVFVSDANEWLLASGRLPRDYRLRLLAMEPSERMQAITYLRRTGLLTGPAWPVADLLRPAHGSAERSQ